MTDTPNPDHILRLKFVDTGPDLSHLEGFQTEYPEWRADYPGTDFLYVGLRSQLSNLLLWFGDDTGWGIGIEYHMELLPLWMELAGNVVGELEEIAVPFQDEVDHAVSLSSGVYVSKIPEGWFRITPGRGGHVRS